MVDPYDFIDSPPVMKSKQTRRKSIQKTSKRRKSNEKRRRTPTRQAKKTKVHMPTRSNTHDTEHLMNEKENNHNNGFTQLIQTKMMEVKKRQGKRMNQKLNTIVDENHSPSVSRKRQRTENEDSMDVISDAAEINQQDHNLLSSTNDEHISAGAVPTTITCHPRCESNGHYLIPANKRRRACLCSKRQLDELEFASDSISSQTQRQQEEEQQQQPPSPRDEPQLQPTSMNLSPPPLLLPSSPLMPPVAFTFPVPPVPSTSTIQQEEKNEEEEEEEKEDDENQLHVPSIIAAPLSPAMPLNSTYIAAHRSIPLITQLPSSLLAISTLPLNTTTISVNAPIRSTSSIVQISHLEQKISDHAPLLPPMESISNHHDQETSMTPVVSQTTRCSVSTQTNDDYHPTHHHCNDVSVCPCVQIYTRSEQLFMASMAIFFRNSITITPPEPSLITSNNTTKKSTKRPLINQHNISSQSTPVINEIEIPVQTEVSIEKNNNIGINETYIINNQNDTVPVIEREPQRSSSSIPLDISTVINETSHENSKKSDGSSIQINIDTRQNLDDKPSSDNQEKLQSLVLAMTALKDHQKIEFNRFLERFSVRSSTSIDDTTTHLITDEDTDSSLICPLTGKVLQAVTRHLKIVSYRWLTACLTEQRYVDEIPTYEIIGDTIYNHHGGMARSRINHSNNLLTNYAFHLKCHGCQPFLDNRPIIELIHLSGGLVLKTLNQHIDNIGRQIVILCSKNYLQNKLALQQACQKLNIVCIEPEWLIASIVKFEIQPYQPWLCTLYS